ncbi:acyl-CoA N-acyltransferase [Aspergillus avenaceus]|uniref:Acyl-CoA N-acyltransferase n=1 Tax=Aspergillus avenaceus TaxID=36643 RepID=A0A5N6U1V0_ASPAV|nr:acyl-CoA N-acyltransferase [Aspergillus avenaceus]
MIHNQICWSVVATLPPARCPTAATSLTGRTVSLVHLISIHTDSTFASVDHAAFSAAIKEKANSTDPFFFAVFYGHGRPGSGLRCPMCINLEQLLLEIGHGWFCPSIQRTTVAAEAMFPFPSYAFDTLGYRRVEWRAKSLNDRSRRAALRFGFLFEAIFRQHDILKGRSWDTSWHSLLRDGKDGKQVRRPFDLWLQETFR